MVYSTVHPLEVVLITEGGDTVCSTEKYEVHLG